MAKYKVFRTDTADSHLRKIILYIAENFGNSVALEKLDEIEKNIMIFGEIGMPFSFGLRFGF